MYVQHRVWLRYRTDQNVRMFMAQIEKEDLALMGELLSAGTVKSVIDRRCELSQVGEALRYLGTRDARAKVVLAV